MTFMQREAVIIHGGKILMDLIFVVEGTHKNFNTLKISAYTVYVYVHGYVHIHIHVFGVENGSSV